MDPRNVIICFFIVFSSVCIVRSKSYNSEFISGKSHHFNCPFDPRSHLPLKHISKLQVLPGVCQSCLAAVRFSPEGIAQLILNSLPGFSSRNLWRMRMVRFCQVLSCAVTLSNSALLTHCSPECEVN